MVMDESLKYMSNDSLEPGILKSLTFAVAMSFHSILEGFALGVQVKRYYLNIGESNN